jgi:hypothetical protein
MAIKGSVRWSGRIQKSDSKDHAICGLRGFDAAAIRFQSRKSAKECPRVLLPEMCKSPKRAELGQTSRLAMLMPDELPN